MSDRNIPINFYRKIWVENPVPFDKLRASLRGRLECQNCGYRCDQDVAAVMVMLTYVSGLERPSTNASEITPTGVPKLQASFPNQASQTHIRYC